MILSDKQLKFIAEEVCSTHRREARLEDYKRYLMFNGKTFEVIKEAIIREFKNPETVSELLSRLVPINLVQKIITKLAGIYIQNPLRKVQDESVSDSELMDEYVEEFNLNQRQKEANRYFKLFKRNLQELFVDETGTPHVRNLPRHTYEVFSMSSMTPNRPDVIVKILKDDKTADKVKLAVWSDESHWVIDGHGSILIEEMNEMQNPEGLNPYGKLPFVYINESSDSVDPLTDDDLLKMSVIIPLLLTDLCYATKYQSFSLLWTINYDGNIPSNPNSVIAMNAAEGDVKPEIGQIKPEVDTDKVITFIKTLVAVLLTTKNLSVGALKMNLDSSDVASGISKMIDSADSVEDKTDQQSFFEKAEKDLWNLLAYYMIPYWRANNLLKDELNKEFSSSFEMDIFFMSPKVMVSEMEQIELSKARYDAGFSTMDYELSQIYPQLTAEQRVELAESIEEEKQGKQKQVVDMVDGADQEDEVPEDAFTEADGVDNGASSESEV
jgi:hypothetical protein